jgi:hypothetical protein
VRTALLALVVLACAGSPPPAETTAAPTVPGTQATTTTTTAPPPPCPPAPYDVGYLPPRVRSAETSDTADEPDEFTSIGGTHVRIWVDGDGATAIALIRGALPPRQFPAEKGEVDIAGTRGVAGPYPDGRWVIAWFNPPGDRCDLYTMVFYPPVAPAEVRDTIASMVRTPG